MSPLDWQELMFRLDDLRKELDDWADRIDRKRLFQNPIAKKLDAAVASITAAMAMMGVSGKAKSNRPAKAEGKA